MPSVLTMREAAERLGVHYMTIYRYVRLGLLPARKVGATWQIRESDLAAMRAGVPSGAGGRRGADWAGRLYNRLVAGDEAGAWGVVEAALASGLDPAGVYLDVLAPAMERVGDQWAVGVIEVADEHLATAVAARIVGRLGPRFARRGRSRGSVVVGTAPGELHGLAVAILGDLFRGAGFEVVDLGCNVPVDSLVCAVDRADRAACVALSCSVAGTDHRVAGSIARLRAWGEVPVLVGGAGIRDVEHAGLVGADGYAEDGRAALAWLERRTG
jgi:excisionase family DNA binding protein